MNGVGRWCDGENSIQRINQRACHRLPNRSARPPARRNSGRTASFPHAAPRLLRPVPVLEERFALRFAEQRLGINRLYQGRQNQVEIERVIRVPKAVPDEIAVGLHHFPMPHRVCYGKVRCYDMCNRHDGFVYEAGIRPMERGV